MPPVIDTLKKLGLKPADIEAYLILFQNPDGLFAAQVQKITNIKRSSLDLVLERLRNGGFITFHMEGSRKRYVAESPETLLQRFEESIEELRALVPLLRMTAAENEKTRVRFFEGKEGLEKIFSDILISMKISRQPKKEILIIASDKNIFDTLPNHQKDFIDKRVMAGIHARWIAPKGDASKKIDSSSKQELRQMKFFDGEKYPFTIEVDVYANNIALMNLGKDPSGVIIENRNLAESVRSLFNLTWDFLKV